MKPLTVLSLALLLPGLPLLAEVDLSVGAGNGFLEINNIDERGWLDDADQGTYDAGANTGDTIWEMFFAVVEGDGVTYFDGETSHHAGQRATGGTTSSTSTGFETTGISLPGSPDMNATMQVQLSQPVIGANQFIAQADWTLTLADTGGISHDVRIVCWYDADIYIDGSFDDNVCAFGKGTVSGYAPGNPRGFIGLSNGPAPVDLDQGVLFDVIVPPTVPAEAIVMATVRDSIASSRYWISAGDFATTGFDANRRIHPDLANRVQGDANADGQIDAGSDIGAVIEVATTVPANGAQTITFRLLYGLDQSFQPMPLPPPPPDVWTLR